MVVQKANLIVTHPGSAHFDEMTAISLILAVNADTDFRVERREPTLAELDNPDVWVLDIGNRHEPEKHNFDHHQSVDCSATFVLVSAFLGLTETLSTQPWWNFKDEVDRFGPVTASAKYHAGDDLVNRSPVESWLVDSFASTLNPSADLLAILKSYGSHLIAESRTLKKQIDFWKGCQRLVIGGRGAMIGETKESAGLDEFRRLVEDKPDIVISLDRRGNGWRLFRYDGTPVDFYRLVGRPEIAFAHKTGFMATTKEKISLNKLIELVGGAVVKS